MPKKLTLNIKNWIGRIKSNTTIIFWTLLLVLFALEGWTLNGSLQIILNSDKGSTVGKGSAGVRFSFPEYQKTVDRIENARTYKPAPVDSRDPFTTDADITRRASQ